MPRGRRARASIALGGLVAVIVLAFFIAAGGIPDAIAGDLASHGALRTTVPGSTPIDLEVPNGATPRQIVSLIEKAGVVRDADALEALLVYRGIARKLQAGRYRFVADLPPAEVARILAGGPNRPAVITLREGLRNEEVRDTLDREGVVKAADFDAALAAPHSDGFLSDRPQGASLLGYILPATYPYTKETKASEMAQAMLDAFGKQVTPDIVADAQASGLTMFQVVTLASIVEREAASPEERPLIAAVFRNRLAQRIPLQADPTVQFALTRQPNFDASKGYWKSGLTNADLAVDSIYNTYTHQGLPPGPISNPGIDSIRAVVRPASVDYLYFVASPACDRTHRFASTLAAHNANVAAFQASACAKGS